LSAVVIDARTALVKAPRGYLLELASIKHHACRSYG